MTVRQPAPLPDLLSDPEKTATRGRGTIGEASHGHIGPRGITQSPSHTSQPTAIVVGIGGNGRNAIQFLCDKVPKSIACFVLDQTPGQPITLWRQDLTESGLQMMGTGEPIIRQFMSGIDTLYLISGLGGSAGSDLSTKIIKLARNLSIKTHALVTMPFSIEGLRVRTALKALNEICGEATSCIVFRNENLRSLLGGSTLLEGAFTLHRLWITHALHCHMLSAESNWLQEKATGNCLYMGYGRPEGQNGIAPAIALALQCPLLPPGILKDTRQVFVLIQTPSLLSTEELAEARAIANMYLGTTPRITIQNHLDTRMEDGLFVTLLLATERLP